LYNKGNFNGIDKLKDLVLDGRVILTDTLNAGMNCIQLLQDSSCPSSGYVKRGKFVD
jgi:hypothetical protein